MEPWRKRKRRISLQKKVIPVQAFFSVTLYSNLFPSINLICASIPGNAPKINAVTGMKIY